MRSRVPMHDGGGGIPQICPTVVAPLSARNRSTAGAPAPLSKILNSEKALCDRQGREALLLYCSGVCVRLGRRPRRPPGRGLSWGAVGFRFQYRHNHVNEPNGGRDGLLRLLRRDCRAGANEIVGNGLQIVSARQKRPQFTVKARVVSHQLGKFSLHRCAACSPARYAARPASSGQWCAPNKSLALL